ncbi:13933_t:CDS:2 [Acaulospora colombiana]|uniref:13933_t:CDS:1 n=1 Tax=Acaulospora colombiana TaxID=27376 RepID=A0ACA9KAJ9_9GLOM|nr:13933_t:CDS:2 [Acaulospora colombiana]
MKTTEATTYKHVENTRTPSKTDAIKPRFKEETMKGQIQSSGINSTDVNDLPNLSRELKELIILLSKTARAQRAIKVSTPSDVDGTKRENDQGTVNEERYSGDTSSVTLPHKGEVKVERNFSSTTISASRGAQDQKTVELTGSSENAKSAKDYIIDSKFMQMNEMDSYSQQSQDMDCDSDNEHDLEEGASHGKTLNKQSQHNANDEIVPSHSPKQKLHSDKGPTSSIKGVRFAVDLRPSPPSTRSSLANVNLPEASLLRSNASTKKSQNSLRSSHTNFTNSQPSLPSFVPAPSQVAPRPPETSFPSGIGQYHMMQSLHFVHGNPRVSLPAANPTYIYPNQCLPAPYNIYQQWTPFTHNNKRNSHWGITPNYRRYH